MGRTALFNRVQPGGVYTVDDIGEHGGNIWFVGSDVSGASDSAGYGRNPDAPFATLDYAVGQCTANNHDVIYLLPSHSESWTTTGAKVTFDVAGVRVVGLGNGSDRATFSFGHTGTTWTWSAANVTVENCLFVTAVDSVVTYGTISGADAKLINCEGRDTTDVEVITDWTVTGDRLTVDGYYKNGYVGGNANDAVFSMNGVDGALIQNCRFITKVITSVIEFVTTACAEIEVHNCDFLVTGTTDASKNVVDTITGSTWGVWDSFDLGAGASFSGGSGNAVGVEDISAIETNLTSSATSVGTAVGSIQTNLTSSATSVGTAAGSYATSTQTNLTSSATSVGTAVGSIQTNLTSSATSVGTLTASVGTQESTNRTYLASEWASWESEWSVQMSYTRSGIASI